MPPTRALVDAFSKTVRLFGSTASRRLGTSDGFGFEFRRLDVERKIIIRVLAQRKTAQHTRLTRENNLPVCIRRERYYNYYRGVKHVRKCERGDKIVYRVGGPRISDLIERPCLRDRLSIC